MVEFLKVELELGSTRSRDGKNSGSDEPRFVVMLQPRTAKQKLSLEGKEKVIMI